MMTRRRPTYLSIRATAFSSSDLQPDGDSAEAPPEGGGLHADAYAFYLRASVTLLIRHRLMSLPPP